jgi:hypothetical protein
VAGSVIVDITFLYDVCVAQSIHKFLIATKANRKDAKISYYGVMGV